MKIQLAKIVSAHGAMKKLLEGKVGEMEFAEILAVTSNMDILQPAASSWEAVRDGAVQKYAEKDGEGNIVTGEDKDSVKIGDMEGFTSELNKVLAGEVEIKPAYFTVPQFKKLISLAGADADLIRALFFMVKED